MAAMEYVSESSKGLPQPGPFDCGNGFYGVSNHLSLTVPPES